MNRNRFHSALDTLEAAHTNCGLPTHWMVESKAAERAVAPHLRYRQKDPSTLPLCLLLHRFLLLLRLVWPTLPLVVLLPWYRRSPEMRPQQ